ncbi:TPR end-of-group domain-containing protein [Kribbella sp. NPDC048928]|uniref:alpha/beta hydrolase n=1 Tax=Kribbella sp. NPDC048928 TaxID=3364111 RepID=UPI0037219735
MELTARYDELDGRVYALYEAEQYDEALQALDAGSDGLDGWMAELALLKACILAVSGDPDRALRVLEDASAAGAWWLPETLADDEDLESLQGRPEFDKLLGVSAERVSDDVVPALIDVPDQPQGVVVALHGAGQTAAHAQRDWAGVLERGHALVSVQSSRRMSPRYHSWPDREQAIADIARALAQLPTELQGLPVVAAGFSAGGRAALDWALTAEPSPAAGVLVLAPALRELPDAPAGKLSPATIWIGADDDLLEVVDGMADRLTAFGCTIEHLPGLGHAFPPGFENQLAKAL